MKRMNGGTEIEKKSLGPKNQINGKPAAIGTDIRSNLDATSLPTGHGGGILCDEPEVFDDPAVQNGLVSPRPASAQPPRILHHETGEKEGSVVTKTIHVTSNTTKEIVILDPDDDGIPSEGNWNVTNAYMFRFCFEHGQKEWLLVYADRWMRPSD